MPRSGAVSRGFAPLTTVSLWCFFSLPMLPILSHPCTAQLILLAESVSVCRHTHYMSNPQRTNPQKPTHLWKKYLHHTQYIEKDVRSQAHIHAHMYTCQVVYDLSVHCTALMLYGKAAAPSFCVHTWLGMCEMWLAKSRHTYVSEPHCNLSLCDEWRSNSVIF